VRAKRRARVHAHRLDVFHFDILIFFAVNVVATIVTVVIAIVIDSF
jgi:hypothetical protein